MKKIFLGAFCGLLFLGCVPSTGNSDKSSDQSHELVGVDWVLDEISGKKFHPFIIEGEIVGIPTISFHNTTIVGNDGVNSFSTNYKLSGKNLQTTIFISTMMAAFNPILAATEENIFKILNEDKKEIKVTKNTLSIKSSAGELLYLKKNLIENSSWVLIDISNDVVVGENIEGRVVVPTLDISNNTFYGNAGVNNYNAKYEISVNNTLKVFPVVSTRMASSSPVLTKTENKFIKTLSEVNSFHFSLPGVLVLKSQNTTLSFKEKGFKVGVLNNSVWNLTYIGDTKISPKIIDNKIVAGQPSLHFKDNTFFGSGGVNNFAGQYALKFRNIYFSSPASTMKMGDEELMKIEYKYLNTLVDASYIEIKDNDILTIYTDSEKLIFNRVYM